MQNEELLIPRKKVMIDFPQWSTFKHKKGDILTKKGIHWIGKGTARGINENEIDNYPEIFRDMSWWEERKEEDMSEYIKFGKDTSVWKVDKWTKNMIGELYPHSKNKDRNDLLMIEWHFSRRVSIPATKEEYEAQNNKAK